jgi:hypothetical protein
MHELPHNHFRNPRHTYPLPCVSLYKNTCNNSGPLHDVLSIVEVFSSRFFQSNPSNQVLFLSIYNTPKSKSNHTFESYRKFGHLVSLSSHRTCLHFFRLHQISYSSYDFWLPQNPSTNLLPEI